MTVYFNGRLWTTPVAVSAINDDGMANNNLTTTDNACIIGVSAAGGEPKTAIAFTSPTDAKAALVSGDLCEAVIKAFNQKSTVGSPATVYAMRVNPATQATASVTDSNGNACIALASTDYGSRCNGIKYKIEDGSTAGKKLTTQLGDNYYSEDNITRNAFSIQYSGAQLTATMSITGTKVTLYAPAETVVGTIDLNTYPTISQLVEAINAVTGFSASVEDDNDDEPSLNGLDYVTAVDVRTAEYTALADLQACVDWFDGTVEGYITATRVDAAGNPPANTGWTYLSGAGDGTTTTSDWSDCFTALQSVDVKNIAPLSSNAAIHAMADSHVQYMSTTGLMERRAFCGTALSTSDTAAIAAAKLLNSDRTQLVHLGEYDYDLNGNLKLYAPYFLAARIAGAHAGLGQGQSMTNKLLACYGFERVLRNPADTDPLIKGGVVAVLEDEEGYKVVKDINTWLADTNYNRVEYATGSALDYVAKEVRTVSKKFIGRIGNPANLALLLEAVKTRLNAMAVPEPNGPGVIVGDDSSPAWKGLTASLSGDAVSVQFQCSPGIPMNYVLTTIYAVAYSGSATLSTGNTTSSSS